ncbi:WYL domain-containing protein [Tersicoccus solisilvae]|uniref:WYL domain-containing protein n=1 Tax=Tersicoccus solisilvae TaxID=1882339 RepID=A0ABQ1NRM9_9MICC|nr:WYL domain-containing protein [Tersicoccus solisilvae]GGC83649.1 WYL domain-containing protein [Tersicoccus solisilvae]
MAPRRTERLLNLLIALLERRQGYSKEELRRVIPPYASAGDEAFERMFERDKADLRDLGLPLESFSDESYFDGDLHTVRYRIDPNRYRLPPVRFSTDESAVLNLASRMWQQASLSSAAGRAVRKLSARGVEPATDVLLGVEPRIRATEPAFGPLLDAIVARRPVSFGYQRPEADAPQTRRLQPWGIGNRFGHWYVVGHDEDRDAERTFRLSRMTTPVVTRPGTVTIPAGFTVAGALAGLVQREATETAVVEARPGTALALRPPAEGRPGTPHGGPDAAPAPQDPDWERFTVPYSDTEILAEELAGHGPHVRVLAPPTLRDAVARRLRAARRLADRSPVPDAGTAAPARPRTQRTSRDDLTRLLDLVPYLTEHPGADLSATARLFDVSPQQLVKDLELLFVCGLPGYGPDQLIDASWEEGAIYLGNADELSEPVRLSVDEAGALIVGLQALAAVPGIGQRPAVESALAKISSAASDAIDLTASLHADVAGDGDGLLPTLQRDVRDGRRIVIDYLVPHRDELTTRSVDPWRLFSANDVWYLQGWCYRSGDVRNFRLDRIRAVRPDGDAVVDRERIAAHGGSDPEVELFTRSDDDIEVTVLLSPRGRWVADHFDAEHVADAGSVPGGGWDGWLVARLRVGTTAWLPGLCTRAGGDVRVLAPADVAAACSAWIDDALAVAGQLSSDGADPARGGPDAHRG